MTNESNCPVSHETESASGLKASDFFPPGTGWNRGPANEPQKTPEELDAQSARGDMGQN